MNRQVCRHRLLDIRMMLHHLNCLFFFLNTLLYMSDHHSVDTAISISQIATERGGARRGDSQISMIMWRVQRGLWTCKKMSDAPPHRQCSLLILPNSCWTPTCLA